MSFVNLATGARLHYEIVNDSESGPPVIALHGMLGTARLHLGHVMEWLGTEGYRVIGPTLRGYGESSPKPRDFPPRFYDRDTDDVLALMDALNISRAHIIGYSDGGEIALMAAGKAPDRFVSAASWGAVGYFGPEMRAIAQRMVPGSAWLHADEMAPHGLTDADAFASAWVRSVVQMIDAGGDVSVGIAPAIVCPVLIMLGRADTLNPAVYAQRFLAGVKNGRLEMFDCGHPVHDEQPAAFQKILLDHLKRADTP